MDAVLNELGYFTPTDPIAECMFSGMFCGCIAPFTGKIVRDEKGNDQITMTENTWLFCLPPSPCPCCMCCGVGPCAQKPRFIKETDTKYVGSGHSLFAGDCCVVCFHNRGDKMEVVGDAIEWSSGSSPFYPPCLQNKKIGDFKLKAKGGAPTVSEMER